MNTEESHDSASSDREMVNVVGQNNMTEISSELASVRTDLEFQSPEEEVEKNEPQGQPLDSMIIHDPPLQEQTISGVEPPNLTEQSGTY